MKLKGKVANVEMRVSYGLERRKQNDSKWKLYICMGR